MNPQTSSETGREGAKVFSAAWSDKLGAAIAAAAPKQGYRMSLVGEDSRKVITAVNQGIDAHLEACFVPDRGDRFISNTSQGIPGKMSCARLDCEVSPQSLVTLVRRLMNSGDPAAESLASSICQTLGIELV
jgi:hypothetical protein